MRIRCGVQLAGWAMSFGSWRPERIVQSLWMSNRKLVPKARHEETPEIPRAITNPIPLFGIPAKTPTVSFRTFDDASVRDSVSFAVPRQPTPPMHKVEKPKGICSLGRQMLLRKGNFYIQWLDHRLHMWTSWRL